MLCLTDEHNNKKTLLKFCRSISSIHKDLLSAENKTFVNINQVTYTGSGNIRF